MLKTKLQTNLITKNKEEDKFEKRLKTMLTTEMADKV